MNIYLEQEGFSISIANDIVQVVVLFPFPIHCCDSFVLLAIHYCDKGILSGKRLTGKRILHILFN